MTYLFKSKAVGDLLMLGPSGDQLLRIIGKEPAAQGIIESAAMPAAIRAIEAAVAADEARQVRADDADAAPGHTDPDGGAVTLRQRAWPFLEMLKSAQAAGKEIVWGV